MCHIESSERLYERVAVVLYTRCTVRCKATVSLGWSSSITKYLSIATFVNISLEGNIFTITWKEFFAVDE
jgi:hypothetical protein